MTTHILFLASDHTDHTVTFSINGLRWEYFLHGPNSVSDVEYIARKVSLGKALALAKRHATHAMALT